jgi:hypothetical protein
VKFNTQINPNMNVSCKYLLSLAVLLVLQTQLRANLVPGLQNWSYSGDALYSTVAELPPGVPDVVIFNTGNSIPNGSIADSFATVAGDEYQVDFDYSTGTAPDATAQQLAYSALGNALLAGGAVTGPLDPLQGGPDFDSIPSFVPTTFSFDFTADSPATTLQFSDLDTNQTISEDGDLYNVCVVQTGIASVPEQGSAAMLLGFALVGIGSIRFWRRQ